ncbi:uncharacterized protein LOC135426188 isoform X1 [Drosophila montana]|uniref:uncharacterized protein LOC135426188 isoform X1 n=1 Tax=Drosophila montana TaxID=40370 RepID=UPI00313C7E3F
MDKVWIDKARYDNAEKLYYERLCNVTKPNNCSFLVSEIAKAREHIQSSLEKGGPQTPIPSYCSNAPNSNALAEKPANMGAKKKFSKNKQTRDFTRMEKKRGVMSTKNDKDTKEALYDQLFYVYKNVSAALKSIPLSLAPRTIVLPITSRAVGFIIRHFISKLSRLQMPNINLLPLCHALYRVTLLQLDMKLNGAMEGQCCRNVGGQEFVYTDVPDNFGRAILGLDAGIAPLINLIHSIGYLKLPATAYLPRYGVCRPTDPSNVRFANLRTTVMAMATDAIAANIRRRFFERNPIPGAIWREAGEGRRRRADGAQPNPSVLQNAADIMPQVWSSQLCWIRHHGTTCII